MHDESWLCLGLNSSLHFTASVHVLSRVSLISFLLFCQDGLWCVCVRLDMCVRVSAHVHKTAESFLKGLIHILHLFIYSGMGGVQVLKNILVKNKSKI